MNISRNVSAVLLKIESLVLTYNVGILVIDSLESINDWNVARELVKKVCGKYKLPYFTVSPVFSICPVHGYVPGEHHSCPHMEDAKNNESQSDLLN